MTDEPIRLDSIPGCIRELTDCNQDVAGFAVDWSEAAGELKRLEKVEARLYKSAMRGTTGANADLRAATAQAAVEQAFADRHPDEPPLYERIEELVGQVETFKRHFETIERRSSNAQSILAAHRKAADLDGFVPREAREMAARAA